MGACTSKGAETAQGNLPEHVPSIIARQEALQKRVGFSLEVQVAHFTPSSFPMLPTINKRTSRLCEESWARILENESEDDNNGKVSGMTMFYDEFYRRLEVFDTKGQYEAILVRSEGWRHS